MVVLIVTFYDRLGCLDFFVGINIGFSCPTERLGAWSRVLESSCTERWSVKLSRLGDERIRARSRWYLPGAAAATKTSERKAAIREVLIFADGVCTSRETED